VGFLRYWTLSNLPLFLIAAPMLWLLFWSSAIVLRNNFQHAPTKLHVAQTAGPADLEATDSGMCDLPQLVLPQLALAIAASTNFHVQIINRISSGYPIWYLVVVTCIAQRKMTDIKWQTLERAIPAQT